MSILTMTQDIATETGFPKPSTALGNLDLTVIRIVAKINEAGRWLKQQKVWDRLVKEHTFTEVSGTADYALPSDFDRFIPYTHYNRTETLAFRGPLTAQEWQLIKSGGAVQIGQPAYRIKLDITSLDLEFIVEPQPTASGDTFVFEYVSSSWVKLASGSSDRFGKSGDTTADTNSSLLPEDLVTVEAKWRFLESIGMPFASTKKEAEDLLSIWGGRQGPQHRTVRANDYFQRDFVLGANTPERGFG